MPDTNRLLLRLALLIAPFAVVDGANAACALEGIAMADQSRIGTAKGGVRVAF